MDTDLHVFKVQCLEGYEGFTAQLRGIELEDKIGLQLVQIYERFKDGGQIKNVIVPFTDGKRIYQIPVNLQEAAEIDGANEMVYFFRVLLPVCTPIIATIAMWNFVGMWNSYFDAMIYLNSASKQPLQLVLRSILIQSQPEPGMVSDTQSTAERAQLAELLKYATIIISSLPLLIMYPFFQRYFDSGIMAGAVKG